MYESYMHSCEIYNMKELLENGTAWESGGSSDGQEIADRIPAYNDYPPREGPAYAGSNAHIQASIDKSADYAKDITLVSTCTASNLPLLYTSNLPLLVVHGSILRDCLCF
jgi:hypothetical protein